MKFRGKCLEKMNGDNKKKESKNKLKIKKNLSRKEG